MSIEISQPPDDEGVYLLAPEPAHAPQSAAAPAASPPTHARWNCTAHGVGYTAVLLCLVVAWLVDAPVQLIVVLVAIGLALCCMDKNAPPCLAVAVTALAVVVLSVIVLQVAGLAIVHLDTANSTNATTGTYGWVFPSVVAVH